MKRRKLVVTVEVEYEGGAAPLGAGSLDTLRGYCLEGSVVLAQRLREFYQMGGAQIARAEVVDTKWNGGAQ